MLLRVYSPFRTEFFLDDLLWSRSEGSDQGFTFDQILPYVMSAVGRIYTLPRSR